VNDSEDLDALRDELWETYLADRSLSNRDQLAAAYYDWVRSIAIRATIGNYIFDEDDLFSEGVIGLLESIARYDSKSNARFTTFAGYRIRGAMKDALRGWDSLTRAQRRDRQQLELDGFPAPRTLSMTFERYKGANGRREATLEDEIADDKIVWADKNIEWQDQWEYIMLQCKMSRRERLSAKLYYLEGIPMKEVGRTIGVSESRVSQMMSLIHDQVKSCVAGQQLQT